MTVNDIVKLIMTDKQITQRDLQELLNLSSQSGISQTLRRDMRASTLTKVLNAMDCELVIRTKDGTQEWIVGDKY